jgi:hypothetical protein
MFQTSFSRCFTLALMLGTSYGYAVEWKVLSTGYLEPYHQQKGKIRQDISGGCVMGQRFFLVDDGGENADQTSIRAYQSNDHKRSPKLLPLELPYRDLEATTCFGNRLTIATSLSMADEEQQGFRLFSEIQIDTAVVGDTTKPWIGLVEKSVDLRNPILEVLRAKGPSADWFKRAYSTFAKLGGLNLEGLSFDPNVKSGYLIGLRSPLWHTKYGNPALDPSFSLNQGDAIVLQIKDPYADTLDAQLHRLDLKGTGIRSMEYIPSLDLTMLISGSPTSDQGFFNLWMWKQGSKPVEVKVPGFDKMCRPETIAPFPCDGGTCVIVITEQSGRACKDPSAPTYLILQAKS